MDNPKLEYDQYLADLHTKLNIPDQTLQEVVKEATGLLFVSKQRIIAGEVSEVYDLTLENKDQIIARISRKEEPDYEQEKWAIDQGQKAGVPVPEILLIKNLILDNQQISLCVQKKLVGDPLERGKIDYHDLDGDYLKKMIVKSGEILSRIHSVSTAGFGELNGQGEGRFKNFHDLMAEKVEQEEKYRQMASDINFDLQIMEMVLQIMKNNLGQAQDIKPVLVHGDFAPKHIMVKGDEVTGILDWGEVTGNSPIFDFARWDYWFGHELPIDWLKEGYTNKALFNQDFEALFHWIRLDIGLGTIWWYHKQKYHRGVEGAKKKLIDDLKFFR